MTGKIFLAGGGDEKQSFVIDEIFLKDVKKILYIPIARKDGNYGECLNWFRKAMGNHKKVQIEMCVDLNNKINVEEYDAMYIGGGNTFKLLKNIKDSGFDKKLLKYYKSGGIIYGGSAGAIIWGRDISIALICYDVDENSIGLKDTSGINILNGIDIQCHYHASQRGEHFKYIAKTKKNIVAIPEESALVLEGEKCSVVGEKPIFLITQKEYKEFSPNEIIKLKWKENS